MERRLYFSFKLKDSGTPINPKDIKEYERFYSDLQTICSKIGDNRIVDDTAIYEFCSVTTLKDICSFCPGPDCGSIFTGQDIMFGIDSLYTTWNYGFIYDNEIKEKVKAVMLHGFSNDRLCIKLIIFWTDEQFFKRSLIAPKRLKPKCVEDLIECFDENTITQTDRVEAIMCGWNVSKRTGWNYMKKFGLTTKSTKKSNL